MRTQRASHSLAALVSAALMVASCNEVQQQSVEDFNDHINNSILFYCDIYRSADYVTRESIEQEIQRLMNQYDGRIDRDTEYCLNSMGIER